jgi:hypothetical protein
MFEKVAFECTQVGDVKMTSFIIKLNACGAWDVGSN